MTTADEMKRAAAQAAVAYVPDDSVVGVGTGSTVNYFIDALARIKGRIEGAATITVTKNEVLYSLNKPDDFILAIVEFQPGNAHRVHYLRQPFRREPDFGVTSVNYDLAELLERAEEPR